MVSSQPVSLKRNFIDWQVVNKAEDMNHSTAYIRQQGEAGECLEIERIHKLSE